MVHMIPSNVCVMKTVIGEELSTSVFLLMFFFSFFLRMKPRKIKEDDAPRTIACPHKVSEELSF